MLKTWQTLENESIRRRRSRRSLVFRKLRSPVEVAWKTMNNIRLVDYVVTITGRLKSSLPRICWKQGRDHLTIKPLIVAHGRRAAGKLSGRSVNIAKSVAHYRESSVKS